jgi:hypothetical protein
MENKFSISENWSLIAGVLTVSFVAGGVVSEFRLMRAEIEELKKETAIKIQQIQDKDDRKKLWLEEQEQRIDDLEEWKSFVEGSKILDK